MKFVSFLRRHSPTVLSILGGAGTIGTAVLAVKATPDALWHIRIAEEDKGTVLTKKEAVQTAWKDYIPAAGVALSTLLCIFGANWLNSKRQASLVSAYAMLHRLYSEYRHTVADTLGDEQALQVEQVFSKRNLEAPETFRLEEPRTYFESECPRFFECTQAKVNEAGYRLNRQLIKQGHVSLNDYYGFLGIPKTEKGEMLGWGLYMGPSEDESDWIDFTYLVMHTDDDMEVCEIIPSEDPYEDYRS